jgi:hypothetical protein
VRQLQHAVVAQLQHQLVAVAAWLLPAVVPHA